MANQIRYVGLHVSKRSGSKVPQLTREGVEVIPDFVEACGVAIADIEGRPIGSWSRVGSQNLYGDGRFRTSAGAPILPVSSFQDLWAELVKALLGAPASSDTYWIGSDDNARLYVEGWRMAIKGTGWVPSPTSVSTWIPNGSSQVVLEQYLGDDHCRRLRHLSESQDPLVYRALLAIHARIRNTGGRLSFF